MAKRVKVVGTLLRMNTKAETEEQPTPIIIHSPFEGSRLGYGGAQIDITAPRPVSPGQASPKTSRCLGRTQYVPSDPRYRIHSASQVRVS